MVNPDIKKANQNALLLLKPPSIKTEKVITPSANSCIIRPIPAKKPVNILLLNVTVYIRPSIKECMAIPSTAVIPNARAFCLVLCWIILLLRNMNRNPTRAAEPADEFFSNASGKTSTSGTVIRRPAAKHIK